MLTYRSVLGPASAAATSAASLAEWDGEDAAYEVPFSGSSGEEMAGPPEASVRAVYVACFAGDSVAEA